MTPDFLDYIFESVCRSRALLFTPFTTTDVLYDSIDQLLSSCGFVYPSMPVLEADINETERIMVFAEGLRGVDELKNLECALRGLNIHVDDRRFMYERALFVVVDRLSRVPVNVEHRHCVWASFDYNIGGGPNFFECRPVDLMVNQHSMLRACAPCIRSKSRCRRGRLMECVRCTKLGIECEVGPYEATERRRLMHKLVKSELHTLCAVHQFVILTHGRRLGEQVSSAAHMNRLTSFVHERVPPCWNHECELKLMDYADSLQVVTIEDGIVTIRAERAMEEWWGYERVDAGMMKEDRRSVVTPHLGMARPYDAGMFLDHAMRRPGELFFRDECILNRRFEPVSVRIMAIVAVIAPGRFWMHLGWKKP